MVLEKPTKKEIERFDKLQKDGMLPGQALKKIETERRLGIIPDDTSGFFKNEDWWFYGSLAAIGAGIIYVYIKTKSSTS